MTEPKAPAHLATDRRAAPRQKVPEFARYEGTSAWKKDRKRVRAFARFKAATAHAQGTAHT
jgi:hypothetical protein